MQFTITSQHAKMRLDKFLKEHFPGLSRAHLQKLIEQGQVKVNGKTVAPHHFLKEGDEVEATIEPPEELRVVANAEVKIVIRNPSQPPLILRGGDDRRPPLKIRGGRGSYDNVVEVIHEEPDFIVVNKPAGLVVHQGEGHKAPDTLVNGLLARYKDSPLNKGLSFSRVGEDPLRPGIVHRLDADVSGVMVVARTQDMFDHLKRQFKMHEVEKEYVAVVHGKVSPPEGVIEFAVARKEGKMVARPKIPSPQPSPLGRGRKGEGKRAVTEYETIPLPAPLPQGEGECLSIPLPRGEGMKGRVTLLRIVTKTGRTHQIRVHLKAIGHPIVGDRVYGLKVEGLRIKGSEPKRLMLYARRIAFKDLTGARREFICPEPDEFLS